MIKRLCLALAGLFAFLSVANAAGTVPGFSLTPQFDSTGKPASGCRLYVIQAGTVSTPQNPYFDSALTSAAPNPLLCDATGRLPLFYLADGNIKLRLADKSGIQLFVGDNIPVVGPSGGGGGGGGTVDPTTIASTGDMKAAYGTSILSGWVRGNGRTIGNATSGATERANADTSALFAYLWNADPNLTVSGGRGVSASADFSASKTITLPDFRGRTIAGLDDMGNTAAGRLTTSYFGAVATTLGAVGGSESQTLTIAQMPSHYHSASIFDPGHTHPFSAAQFSANSLGITGSSAQQINLASSATASATTGVRVTSSNGLDTTNSAGGGLPHPIVAPTILTTIYIKM